MNNSTDLETITFYDVPLVCGAALSIGCGSRAKPLLTDLERQTPIEEAWLNRTGTIVAIVWRGPARMDEVIRPVFETMAEALKIVAISRRKGPSRLSCCAE